jgi:hypothetical protein
VRRSSHSSPCPLTTAFERKREQGARFAVLSTKESVEHGAWRDERSNAYAAQALEYLVEEGERAATSHLGDVVHGLARIVAHPAVLVAKALEHGRDQLVEVSPCFLRTTMKEKRHAVSGVRVTGERMKTNQRGPN